jgi:hypothetical protein
MHVVWCSIMYESLIGPVLPVCRGRLALLYEQSLQHNAMCTFYCFLTACQGIYNSTSVTVQVLVAMFKTLCPDAKGSGSKGSTTGGKVRTS